MTQQNPDPPEILVDVSAPCPAWGERDMHSVSLATLAVKETFSCAVLPTQLREARSIEISILLANDDLVRTLNREYRGKDSPTNVLSFPQIEYSDAGEFSCDPSVPVNLGDIVLAYETVLAESEEKIIPFNSHFLHLIVHGTLHLLGFDHETEDEASLMEDTEIWIMNRMGHQNPYSW